MSKYLQNIAIVKRLRCVHIARGFKKYCPHIFSIYFLFFCIFKTKNCYAQDLRFTQFHASDAYLNAAFAGSGQLPRIALNFRDQWPDIPQTYVSYRFSYDQPVSALHSGIGIFAVKNEEGNNALSTLNAGVQYMYQAKFSDKLALNTGIQASYYQKTLNWEQLKFLDQINLVTGFNDINGLPNPTTEPVPPSLQISFMDFSAGVLLYSDKWYIGFSAMHLTQPVQSFYNTNNSKLPIAFSGQLGMEIKNDNKREPFIFNPVIVFSTQAGFNQLLIGSYFKKGIFFPGFFVKHNFKGLSDISFLIGLSKGMISFAYNYDITAGTLSGASGGSHELSFIITFYQNQNKLSSRHQKSSLDCPGVL